MGRHYGQVFLAVLGLVLVGLVVALAPPLYAGIAIVSAIGLVLVFIRPEIGLYLLTFSVPFQSLRSSDPTEVKVTITEGVVALAIAAFLARQLAVEHGTWRRGPL